MLEERGTFFYSFKTRGWRKETKGGTLHQEPVRYSSSYYGAAYGAAFADRNQSAALLSGLSQPRS